MGLSRLNHNLLFVLLGVALIATAAYYLGWLSPEGEAAYTENQNQGNGDRQEHHVPERLFGREVGGS
jgi:hypothetical protein